MSKSNTYTSPARAPRRHRRLLASLTPVAAIAIAVAVVLPTSPSDAATNVGLGTATSFAVLAGSGITNTGPTTITGDVGTHPTAAETGFGSVTLHGANHPADAVALQAKNDLTTAYNSASGQGPDTAVAVELGGRTLTPGIYGAGTLAINGTLTLNTLGNPNAVFIFKSASTLITGSGSRVVVANGTACNVYWRVPSSATLGTGSHLVGSVLAGVSITATTAATIQGRLLAETGAVTLDTNTITRPVCAAATTTTTSGGSRGITAPTPSTTPGGTTATVPGGGPAPAPGSPGSPGSPATPVTPVTPGAPGTPGTPALPPLPITE
jgi:hypothetical protein